MKEALTLGLLMVLLVGCTVVSPGTTTATPSVNVTNNINNVNEQNASINVRNSERDIRIKIAASQACSVDSDCVDIGSTCPFGCHVSVNRGEAGRIQALIAGYSTDCTYYSCGSIDRIACISGKCMAVIGETPNDDNSTG
jgi:hypothetical protein